MLALIIDDSRGMRSILCRMVQQLGFETEEAVNGRDALERLKQIGKPALVLVDWNLPVMNGLEFIRSVRADSAYDAVPLVMVTTETEISQISLALESGANEYVMKPFTQEVLQGKLELLGMPLKEVNHA